jgi:hypothetical protein
VGDQRIEFPGSRYPLSTGCCYVRVTVGMRAPAVTVMWQRAVGQMTCVCRKGANLLACGSASVGTPSRRGKEHVLASTTSACARGQGQADAPPWQRPPMLTGSTSS